MTLFHNTRILLILVFLIVLFYENVFGIDYFSKENIIAFADNLFEEGDYAGAILEYKRLLITYPDISDKERIYLKLGISYEKLSNYTEAIYLFKKAMNSSVNFLRESAFIRLCVNYMRQGMSRDSIDLIEQYKGGNLIMDEVGLIYTLNQISISNYSLAREMLKKPATLKDYDSISNEIEYVIRGFESLPEKSPFLSAFFSSIIPGSGKIYSGRTFDGIFSLFLISSFAGFSTLYFMRDGVSSWQGWLLSGMGFVFYVGDIYGSYKAAEKYNRNKEEELFKKKWELVEKFTE